MGWGSEQPDVALTFSMVQAGAKQTTEPQEVPSKHNTPIISMVLQMQASRTNVITFLFKIFIF